MSSEVKLEECRNEQTNAVDTLILRANKRTFLAVYRERGNDYGCLPGWEVREVGSEDSYGQWWTDVAQGLQTRREVKEHIALLTQP